MLELKNIKKDYLAGENTVHALKGIDLKFRSSEFVSILGPSGCGKTTMLNIIGGLDQYSDGDLIINGKSTKDFKDRDWDTYRNHSVGFVFQSYNLIPHQTVLQNVELALTLSGVSKNERRERAKKALEEVGLGNQFSKKPSEMSGGQMQRVAIARALINNPDIILADEPTGALDTETSVQVMEILKKVSKNHLIVMVTHNPELAEKYSSRIIRMIDGNITSDSAPLSDEEIKRETETDQKSLSENKKVKKPSMSFFTAFSLSLKNLFTKKGRTTLTAFAGSIGIIGIALILSISQGLSGYISDIQESALSSYPLTIEAQNTDLTSIMQTFMTNTDESGKHDNDAVYKKSAIYNIINSLNNLNVHDNDLKSFKEFLDKENADKDSQFSQAINGIKYQYDLDMQVYTKTPEDEVIRADTTALMQELVSEIMGVDMSAMTNMAGSNSTSLLGVSTMGMGPTSMFEELLTGDNGEQVNKLLKKQYDLVYGSWPNSYDEVVLVLDKNNELSDITLYALGLESKETVTKLMNAAINGGSLEVEDKKWSYEEICNMEFKVVPNSICYTKDASTGAYLDLRESNTGLQYLYNNGINIKVSGIIKPNKDATATMLTGNIGYTSLLTEKIIELSKNSDSATIIKDQLATPNVDVLTGLPFNESTGTLSAEEKENSLKSFIDSLDERGKAEMFVKIMSIPPEEYLTAASAQAMQSMTPEQMRETIIQALIQEMGASEETVSQYIEKMSDEEVTSMMSGLIAEKIKMEYAAEQQAVLAPVPAGELVSRLNTAMASFTTEQCAMYYDNVMEFSENTYEDNLKSFGYIDLDNPSSINIYASSFANKDIVEDTIKKYNKSTDANHRIEYTDYVGIMMSSVTSIINAITYVLIAFVSISLIVSSIMIGVITLISVQERTKEIGILRAIGASKKDVSSMFNAETVIIGFCAGLLGVIVTVLLCLPINMIIHRVTGINSLNAYLPVPAAIILILISVFLTLIAGIIPSRSAAKKDPVVALRTE